MANRGAHFSIGSLLGNMPLWFKLIFLGQFLLYAAVIYVAYHFISKVW